MQVFISFANFYQQFIQGFSRIAALLTSMLKATSVAPVKKASFLILEAKLAFIQLQQVFTKAPIFRYFDPKSHILIETNASYYTIGDILSQLASDLGQSNPVAFFAQK